MGGDGPAGLACIGRCHWWSRRRRPTEATRVAGRREGRGNASVNEIKLPNEDTRCLPRLIYQQQLGWMSLGVSPCRLADNLQLLLISAPCPCPHPAPRRALMGWASSTNDLQGRRRGADCRVWRRAGKMVYGKWALNDEAYDVSDCSGISSYVGSEGEEGAEDVTRLISLHELRPRGDPHEDGNDSKKTLRREGNHWEWSNITKSRPVCYTGTTLMNR